MPENMSIVYIILGVLVVTFFIVMIIIPQIKYNNAKKILKEFPNFKEYKKEYYDFVEDRIEETLSDFEKQVLHRYTNGESYMEIANKLNSPVKSVDNAIQRIRKKTIKNILNYDE